MIKFVRVLAAATLISACSGGADGTAGSAPSVDVGSVSSQTVMKGTGCTGLNGSCVHPLVGRIPPRFCVLQDKQIPANYVLALRYYLDPFYSDGWHIRFPTPWVTLSTDEYPWLYETGYGAGSVFEGLINVAPSAGAPCSSAGRHEFLVHQLTGDVLEQELGETPGSDKFFVGIVNAADNAPAVSYMNLTLSDGSVPFQDPANEVEATFARCGFVMIGNSAGQIMWSGEWYQGYDEHDPINHPG